MGKGKKEITIGYKYFVGLHAVLCQSPVDGLVELIFDDRRAWGGLTGDGQISVVQPNLFGGKEREGGVSGLIDIEGGAASQPTNDYLQGQLGAFTPAYRGVFGMVFRHFYFGNNPYLKPWAAKVMNIYQTYQNWLPALAPLNGEFSYENVSIHIAFDQSNSMNLGTRNATAKAAVNLFLGSLGNWNATSVRIQPFAGPALRPSIERFNVDASDLADLQGFIDGMTTGIDGTDFNAGLNGAASFFTNADGFANRLVDSYSDFIPAGSGGGRPTNRRIVLFITDGEPLSGLAEAQATLAAIEGVQVYGFNIELEDTSFTEQIDNTPGDGVPVIPDDDPGKLLASFQSAFGAFVNINPIHILRDVLISPTSDGDGDASSIGDSFATAAATIFAEDFGISLFWQNTGKKDEFRKLVESHIDAVTYFDAITGKWEVKLIRPDYDVGDLFTFDSETIIEWSDYSVPQQDELPNQVTLEFTRRRRGEVASITRTNIAAVQSTGQIVNEKVTLSGITTDYLASVVCLRELNSRTLPIARGAFKVAYCPPELNLGSAIIINEPTMGINGLVARITEMEETDGRDNSVLIRFAQDVFATDPAVPTGLETPSELLIDSVVDYSASPPTVTLAQEMPYYTLVQELGQAEVDSRLGVDMDLGVWEAVCDKPDNSHVASIIVQYDAGSDSWVNVAPADFAPVWQLTSDLGRAADSVTFTAAETGSEFDLAANSLMIIGEEIVRLDSVVVADGVATFTVGRGCLDTVPAEHPLGRYAVALSGYSGADLVDYTAGEEVTLRVLPKTSRASLPVDLAEDQVVTFASRAFRPYPVGKLQVEGEYEPLDVLEGTVTVTWAHRDRLSQTTLVPEDFTEASIGPEAGVAYSGILRLLNMWADLFDWVDVFAQDDWFLDPVPDGAASIDFSPTQVTSYDLLLEDADFFGTADIFALDDWFFLAYTDRTLWVEFGVSTSREASPAYTEWQTPFVRIRPLLPVVDLIAVEL